METVGLRLLHIIRDVLVDARDGALRDEDDVDGGGDDHDEDERAHARPLRRGINAAPERTKAPIGEINERQEPEHDEDGGDGADRGLDVIPRLVPVRQVERHERCGRERVPDGHIVRDLRHGDERHEEG